MPTRTPSQMRGKTPAQKRQEAAEEANLPPLPGDDTVSGTAEPIIGEAEDIPPGDPGAMMDEEISSANVVPIGDATGGGRKEDKAKSTPPRVDEWQDFFSRIVIKAGTDWYLSHAFAGIDEEALSPREVKNITLTAEERERIAKPFAEFANKLKWTRKHGRAIVASAGSVDSLITLGQWFSRVNRIARKHHRRQQGETIPGEVFTHEHSGPDTTAGNGSGPPPNGVSGRIQFFQPGTG